MHSLSGADAPSAVPARPNTTFDPVETIAGADDCGLLILCDHARNALPADYGTLGLPQAELERHIGYDIGAAPLTRQLAARLGAPAVLTTFSRLLIDPNRGEDDPTIVMRISDGALIPDNAYIDEEERQRRIERFYRPYHAAVAATLDRMLATGRVPMIFSVHSFTPVWRGWARPWHAGVLWDQDPRMPERLLAALKRDSALIVGDNEPYVGALRNDTMYKHATARGLAHALIEVRQDLIGDETGVADWTARLAPILTDLNAIEDLHVVRHFGSKTDDPRSLR
ncbi:putative N-formylglutamate amidohydrolase [Breoghania corrubedonensis]|uniref:Putative N-formylglutamate amidohydrolase n=1 Tax=Breoghania corrubedonensis TaxID=665038 RepID=A0A2T5V6W5_9HYPH|nr:N-formylglutamate amidohydrolase [Breoghania corrubedonensis]PTW59494.1 putative N-formylglutamate amidohydrolase [Breoghania corrubedonensis]